MAYTEQNSFFPQKGRPEVGRWCTSQCCQGLRLLSFHSTFLVASILKDTSQCKMYSSSSRQAGDIGQEKMGRKKGEGGLGSGVPTQLTYFPLSSFLEVPQNFVIWTSLAAKESHLLFWAVILLAKNQGFCQYKERGVNRYWDKQSVSSATGNRSPVQEQ